MNGGVCDRKIKHAVVRYVTVSLDKVRLCQRVGKIFGCNAKRAHLLLVEGKPVFFLLATDYSYFCNAFDLRKKWLYRIQGDLLHVDRRTTAAVCFHRVPDHRENRWIHFLDGDLQVSRQAVSNLRYFRFDSLLAEVDVCVPVHECRDLATSTA